MRVRVLGSVLFVVIDFQLIISFSEVRNIFSFPKSHCIGRCGFYNQWLKLWIRCGADVLLLVRCGNVEGRRLG
jgi:hypothetical protein